MYLLLADLQLAMFLPDYFLQVVMMYFMATLELTRFMVVAGTTTLMEVPTLIYSLETQATTKFLEETVAIQ